MNVSDTERNLLTDDDMVFLENIKAWMRTSSGAPRESDLVFLCRELSFSPRPVSNRFVTLGELVTLCNDNAGNRMIYEAWLSSALDNIYSASAALNKEDGYRLIALFKAIHGINSEDSLALEASEALEDARQALYG